MVSHASNHALDYSYGGLRETWAALDEAGVAHAGTGENLADAREPAIVDTPKGRVAMVSVTSSFPRWGRAGDARKDMRGRPGVNPLRTEYAVGLERAAQLRELGEAFGLIVTETDEELVLQRPESRNAVYRFEKSEELDGGDGDGDAVVRRPHERDLAGTLRAIENAATRADLTIAHLHTHDFRAGGTADEAPHYVERFAREAAETGADVVVCQGSHAPLRGIEIHEGTPICYDPGDYVITRDGVTRQPSDFYYRYEHRLNVHPLEATLPEVIRARGPIRPWERESVFADEDRMPSPVGGFFTGPGSVFVRCRFDDDLEPEELFLYPVSWFSEPKALTGFPRLVDGDLATEILEHLADLSAAYGTTLEVDEEAGVGRVPLSSAPKRS